MPLASEDVALAMASGLSAICALCTNYWTSPTAGPLSGLCTKTGCSGPLAGNDFPHYAGPLTSLETLCFVCGKPPALLVRAHGRTRKCGVCKVHLPMMQTVGPAGSVQKPKHAILINAGNGEELLQEPVAKPSLVQAMADTEEELAWDRKKRE